MRVIHICAALMGLSALVMLSLTSHAFRAALIEGGLENARLAGFVQLTSAAAGLALARASGRLSLFAGALILGGAALFAAGLYLAAFGFDPPPIAPLGGVAMMAGWALLTFAKPRA